ncbi:hypothetical protein ACFSQU_18205 [Massilia sp. GCM10020059]|uniref:HEPN domain-containing protein n=1 Tax=Massilia agrisoli TaxID=2892444 RepID=A0ABS8IU48_9BURK|nr:hypothetical protein [Massilia agrisoli]MCC6071476.1 hypothetical protein [Massilia agrisoli]
MTPDELWRHAQQLPESTEAERRTKISRSYYALFSYACEFNDALSSEGNLLRKGTGCHNQLTQKLTNPTVTDSTLQYQSRILGTQQQIAHALRIKADYDLAVPITIAEVKKCMAWVTKGMAVPSPAAQKAA